MCFKGQKANQKSKWKLKPPSECIVGEQCYVWVPNDVDKYMIHDSVVESARTTVPFFL